MRYRRAHRETTHAQTPAARVSQGPEQPIARACQALGSTLKRGIGLMLACACAFVCVSCGPRMQVQPSIQPFEHQMPSMPAGATPTRGRLHTLTMEQSKLDRNPLQATERNLDNGRIYYRYYCLMCHGERGDGNGEVGQSYVPRPADLSSPRVTGMRDGELYLRMLTGVGHDPVMEQTVLPNRRWPLVMHVRRLGEGGGTVRAPF